MRHAAILSLLLLSSAGCAAQLRAQGSPQGATVRASVQGDARATAAAGLLAAGLAALTEGAPPALDGSAIAALLSGRTGQSAAIDDAALDGTDEEALAALIAQGPPSEQVGLELPGYALDPRLNPRPEPIDLGTTIAVRASA